MDAVRCLYVEDEEALRWSDWIKKAWAMLELDVPLEMTLKANPDDAIAELKTHGSDYHLLITDIYWGRKHTPLGRHVLLEAAAFPQLARVALSVGSQQEDKDAAETAGAHTYVAKEKVRHNPATGMRELGAAMLQALLACGHEPIRVEATEVHHDAKFRIAALVEEIGKNTLIALTRKLLSKPILRIDAYYIRPGLSGAVVLRLECTLDVAAGKAPERRTILLKAAKNAELISLEYDNRSAIAGFPPRLFASFIDHPPVRSGAWTAIGIDFETGAQTLQEWLAEATGEVDKVMRRLFLPHRGLGEVYHSAVTDRDADTLKYIWNFGQPPDESSLGRRARIEVALDDLEPLIARNAASALFSREYISDFLLGPERCLHARAEGPRGCRQCKTHGDLHGRNVLVDSDDVPILIDPASISQRHWAADLARLCADLLLVGLDAGPESFEWIRVEQWVSTLASVVDVPGHSPTAGDLASRRVLTASRWLRDHINEVTGLAGEECLWEYAMAFGVELLRSTYRQDLPAPKRCAAAIAACVCLRHAFTLLP